MNIENLIKIAKDEDEKIFMKKIIDIFERVLEKGYVQLTNFLDPGQVYLLKYIAGIYKDINLNISGGYTQAERVRVALVPEILAYIDTDFEIETLKIESNKFTRELKHRDLLGTILGCGVTREQIGDIILTEDNDAYIFVTKGIAQYLLENTSRVGREHIIIKKIDDLNIEILKIKRDMKEETIISTSLRMDNVISSAFGISRTVAGELVEQGRVKLNHRLEGRKHKEMEAEDMISVRGYGRCRILKIKGETKKGRRVIEIEK
ncbi:MAG TPA: hypothetical protein DCP90_05470 [Clostridiales bacterium]|nr:MAG: hypothetical protein A2Y22_05605 [Clostridiales bacterium GWD2_32_59]HAN10050.1 hypothetical protein [Clostridiales bacterium]